MPPVAPLSLDPPPVEPSELPPELPELELPLDPPPLAAAPELPLVPELPLPPRVPLEVPDSPPSEPLLEFEAPHAENIAADTATAKSQ
jgi:hypothetical protein